MASGQGAGQPPASNMLELTWDPELARNAGLEDCTLLDKFWRISLYLTELSLLQSSIPCDEIFSHIELTLSSSDKHFNSVD